MRIQKTLNLPCFCFACMQMYEVEVYVGDPYPQDLSMLNNYLSAEAMEYYEEKKMRINLTRIWQLGGEEYPYFLLHLISTIIHEFLHLFFYDNKMHQENTEETVRRLTHCLMRGLSDESLQVS